MRRMIFVECDAHVYWMSTSSFFDCRDL